MICRIQIANTIHVVNKLSRPHTMCANYCEVSNSFKLVYINKYKIGKQKYLCDVLNHNNELHNSFL
jgi:hypothetical protein